MHSLWRRRPLVQRIGAVALYAALAWFGWLMWRITRQYWPIRDDAAFLQIKQDYIEITHWKAAFFVHVFTSMFALAAGFTQFRCHYGGGVDGLLEHQKRSLPCPRISPQGRISYDKTNNLRCAVGVCPHAAPHTGGNPVALCSRTAFEFASQSPEELATLRSRQEINFTIQREGRMIVFSGIARFPSTKIPQAHAASR